MLLEKTSWKLVLEKSDIFAKLVFSNLKEALLFKPGDGTNGSTRSFDSFLKNARMTPRHKKVTRSHLSKTVNSNSTTALTDFFESFINIKVNFEMRDSPLQFIMM